MHYFSPVDKIELLEIIRSEQTSDDTVCSAVNVGLKQGKMVIVVKDGPGFYTTRLLIFFSVEIVHLIREGLSPNYIDEATIKFGFHVGLATFMDEFGIDLIANIVYYLQNTFDERLADLSIIELFQIFVRNNFLGRKSAQGLYIYRNGVHKEVNPKLKKLLRSPSIHHADV